MEAVTQGSTVSGLASALPGAARGALGARLLDDLGGARRTGPPLPDRVHVLPGTGLDLGRDVAVDPALDRGPPKPPLLPELGPRELALLRPLVDRLGLQLQVSGKVVDGQHLVIEHDSPTSRSGFRIPSDRRPPEPHW